MDILEKTSSPAPMCTQHLDFVSTSKIFFCVLTSERCIAHQVNPDNRRLLSVFASTIYSFHFTSIFAFVRYFHILIPLCASGRVDGRRMYMYAKHAYERFIRSQLMSSQRTWDDIVYHLYSVFMRQKMKRCGICRSMRWKFCEKKRLFSAFYFLLNAKEKWYQSTSFTHKKTVAPKLD